ncbi:DUF4252 domain-containing protein [Flavobacterium sp. Fl-77]|uniref:DUF4252 domain-containing protein n=1 Tax=Flavobacterium flavipigmentatum TaxID=2893884 RepID=A0AAJ2W0Y3_9FLAO|nr:MULTISPECIES: DUF4252 domain-containing protein [unclassified Flavobacterium]MDX6182482.1 DUF4252 domain-containing protein [Flavobacterium sp. Fl-33]MDX6185605.1 DUF4252 domain-containing protein [Flavobacterium sp. Fl-77]UFH38791.1 DUF4252 domain-containing protein [Flavobacterium sp. F-70]
MKISVFTSALLVLLTLISCNSEPSLQKYFVENSENKDFIALDVSPNILNLDKAKLSATQTEALNSFDKMNILAFKVTDKNKAEFEAERIKVNTILKDPKYQQLMKFGSGKDGASISYVGTDENIEEFVVFANRKENGFAVVRVLGKDMNPNNIMTLLSVLKESKIDMEQLKPLQQLMK